MPSSIIRSDAGGIATLTLNRPEVLNALSPEVFEELQAQLATIADAPEIGCVVLRGAGRAFSAGADIKAITSGAWARAQVRPERVLEQLESLPQPVIAAVHGFCYTGALELFLACDLAIATDTAKFADTHAKLGIMPAWGMSQRLPRRVGPLHARRLMFTGTPVAGAEAVAMGLVNASVPEAQLNQAVTELAQSIVACSRASVAAEKRLLRDGADVGLSEALKLEQRSRSTPLPDREQRLSAFTERSRT